MASTNEAFKNFIDKLNELYFPWYRWDAYGTYYWIDWEWCFNTHHKIGIIVTPEEWIKILQWKFLTYDL